MGWKKAEEETAIVRDALEERAQAKAMIVAVQTVSSCVEMSMVRGEVRAHYALCELGSLLQTAWSARAQV